MAVAVDSSTPARWAASVANGGSLTSASFTAPADALLVACVSHDGDTGGGGNNFGTCTVSDSGGLTWTQRVARLESEATDGGAALIFTARTTSAVSRTVTAARSAGGSQSKRASVKLYVLTGVDVDGTPVDAVTASNEGGSSTNNLNTTSVTPGGTGLLVCCDCDWNALGLFQTSSNLTGDTAHYAGEISVYSGYRTCTSGVGVSGNLNAAGTSTAQHKWCQVVVREAAAAPPPPSAFLPAFAA